MAAISLFGDTNMAAVTSCEIQELASNDHRISMQKGNVFLVDGL